MSSIVDDCRIHAATCAAQGVRGRSWLSAAQVYAQEPVVRSGAGSTPPMLHDVNVRQPMSWPDADAQLPVWPCADLKPQVEDFGCRDTSPRPFSSFQMFWPMTAGGAVSPPSSQRPQGLHWHGDGSCGALNRYARSASPVNAHTPNFCVSGSGRSPSPASRAACALRAAKCQALTPRRPTVEQKLLPSEPVGCRQHQAGGLPTLFSQIRDLSSPRGINFENHKLTEQALAPQYASSTTYQSTLSRSAGQHTSLRGNVFKDTPPDASSSRPPRTLDTMNLSGTWTSGGLAGAPPTSALGASVPAWFNVDKNYMAFSDPQPTPGRQVQEPISPLISTVGQEPQIAALAAPATTLDPHGVQEQCRETREQVENLSAMMQLLKGDVDGIRQENWKLRTAMKQRLVSSNSQQSEQSVSREDAAEASQDARVPPLPSFLPRFAAWRDSPDLSHASTPAQVLVTGRPDQDDHPKSSLPSFLSDVMNSQGREYLKSQLDAERRFKNIQAAADAAAASAAAPAAAQRERMAAEKSQDAATGSFAAVQNPKHVADRAAGDVAAEVAAAAVPTNSQSHGRPAWANSNSSVSNLCPDVPASGPESGPEVSAANGLRSTPRRAGGLIQEQLATQRAAELQALKNQLADAELQDKHPKDAADTALAAEWQERIAAQEAEEAAKMAEAIAKHREQLAEERAREAAAEAAIAAAKLADQTVPRGKTGQDARPVARSERNFLGASSFTDRSISSPVSSMCSRFSSESHPDGGLSQNQVADQRAAEVQKLRSQLAEAELRNKELQAAADSAAAVAQREHMAAKSAQDAAQKAAAATAKHNEQLADRQARDASAEAAALAMKIAEQSDPGKNVMSTSPQTDMPNSEAVLPAGTGFRPHPDAKGFQFVPDLGRTPSKQKAAEQKPLSGQRLKQQLAHAERRNRDLQAAAESAVATQQQRRAVAKKVHEAAKKAAAEAAATAARHAEQNVAETNDHQGAGPAVWIAPASPKPSDGSAVSALGPVPMAGTDCCTASQPDRVLSHARVSQSQVVDPEPGSPCLLSAAKAGAAGEQQARVGAKKGWEAGKPVATTQQPHERPADKRASDALAEAAKVATSIADQNVAQSYSDSGGAQPVAWAESPFCGPFPYVANPNSTPASRAGSGLLWAAKPEGFSFEAACPSNDQQPSAEQRVRVPFTNYEEGDIVADIAAQHPRQTADNRARDTAAKATALASKNTKHTAAQGTNGLGEVPNAWETQAFSGQFPCDEPPTSGSTSAVNSGFISAINPDRPADLDGSLARTAELKLGNQNKEFVFQPQTIGLDQNPTNSNSQLTLDRHVLPNDEQAFVNSLNAHDRNRRGGELSKNHLAFVEAPSVEPVEPEEEIPCRSSPLRRRLEQVPDARNGDFFFFGNAPSTAGGGLGWRKLRRVVGAAAVFGRLLEDVREKQALGLYDRDWNRPGFGGSSRLMGARLPSQALGQGSRRLSRPGSQSIDAVGVQGPDRVCLRQGSGSLHGPRGVSKTKEGSQKLSAACSHRATPCQSRQSLSCLSEGNDSPASSLRMNGSNAALGKQTVSPQRQCPSALSDSARSPSASSLNLEVVLKADGDDSTDVPLPGSRRLSRPGSQSIDDVGVQGPDRVRLRQGSGSLHGPRGVSKTKEGSQKLSAACAHRAAPCQSRQSLSCLSEGNDSPASSLRVNGSSAALGKLTVSPQRQCPSALSDSARSSSTSSLNLEVVLKDDGDDSKDVSLPKPRGSSTLPVTQTASDEAGTAPATQHQNSHTHSHTDCHTHSDTRSHTHSQTHSKTRMQSKKQSHQKKDLRGSARSAILQRTKSKVPVDADQQQHDVSSGDSEMHGATEGRGAAPRQLSGSTNESLCLLLGLQAESNTDENNSKATLGPQCTTLDVSESAEAPTTAIATIDQSNLPRSDSPAHAHTRSHSHSHTHSHSNHHTHSNTHSHTHSHTHSKSKSQSRLRHGIRSAILQPSHKIEDEAIHSEDPQEQQQYSSQAATSARPRGEAVAAEAARVAARAAAAAGRLHGAAMAKATAMNGPRRVAMPWGGVGVGLPYSGCSWAEK